VSKTTIELKQELALKAVFVELDGYTNFDVTNNIEKFNVLVSEISSWRNPSAIKYLTRYFDDDTNHPEVLFNIVHAIENIHHDIYIGALIHELPNLIDKAPQWAKCLHVRVFNNPDAFNTYKKRLSNVTRAKRNSIKDFLITLKQEQSLDEPVNLLLQVIQDKECREFNMPLDIKALTNDIVKACKIGFQQLSLPYFNLGERICGYNLSCNPDDWSMSLAINTAPHLDTYPDCKNMPSQWVANHNQIEAFKPISQLISEACDKLKSPQDKALFSLNIYEACVKSLEILKVQKAFRQNSRILFSLTSFISSQKETEWFERLNGETEYPG
jgi:hypothetical protein